MTHRAGGRSVLREFVGFEVGTEPERTATISTAPRASAIAGRPAAAVTEHKEPWPEQAASFIGFFIYLLVLKSFFLPLFIIPTGSMAETLCGAHSLHTCPNCGVEYAISSDRGTPPQAICPNCRWVEQTDASSQTNFPLLPQDAQIATRLPSAAGDRIFVHGWDYGPPFEGWISRGPERWDVVVFKVPSDGQTNYIKRLIGLPGETIEIIDGDVFADGSILRKSDDAERSLWMPFYDHDHAPRKPSARGAFHPRWVSTDPAWTTLNSRVMRCDAQKHDRGVAHFTTDPRDDSATPLITDFYGYNSNIQYHNEVSDIRLSAEVTFEGGDGFLELATRKRNDRFIARLHAGGELTLERERLQSEGAGREMLAETNVDLSHPVRIALGNADYRVRVEINGRPVLSTTDEQYTVTPDEARQIMSRRDHTEAYFAAENATLALRHVLIERDIYYTSDPEMVRNELQPRRPPNGGPGHPLKVGPREYFCCGDNSPNSLDGRYWYPEFIGPQLQDDIKNSQYTPGCVPADQMIGRAFFVYWPGFMPLQPTRYNILPDFGRTRWIR